MNQKPLLALALKAVIWACLGVIFFSALYVSSYLFFPFITTKNFAFQISVEIMFFAFLLLCLVDGRYRIRLNPAVLLILLYLVILTVASAFSGNDFYHSFWSNNERCDGILLLLHLSLFCVVLSGFFRSIKEWLYVFDLFLVASFAVALVALDQYLALTFVGSWSDHFMPSSNGARLAGTIGNSGYVGGYMVFGIFTALFMSLKRSQWWAKAWYVLVMLLELFIAVQTFTRGAYLALLVGAGISVPYLMIFYYRNRYLKIAAVSLIVLFVLSFASIFVFKDSDFVRQQPILSRISSISLKDGTANNRLITWGLALQAVEEKPLLGWGQENFYQIFDKYYTTKNTEQWFDRSHNMIFDRATTGGIIGLLSYLALLLLPFYFMWRYYWGEYKERTDDKEHLARRFLTPVIFSILILAYIIQNMFIFEALAIYIPLIMVLSFVGQYGRGWNFAFLDNFNFKAGLAVVMVVLLAPMLWIFNLKPLYANIDFIKALTTPWPTLQDKINAFEEVIGRGTFGNQEYRRHYFNFYEQTIMDYLGQQENRTAEKDKQMSDWSNLMESQFQAQLKENPNSVTNWLLLNRFYNISYYFDVRRLQKATDIAEQAISLSPGRPQGYYVAGMSYYYFGAYFLMNKNDVEAAKCYKETLALFWRGANKNVRPGEGFDQFVDFILSLQSNPASAPIFARLLAEEPINNSTSIEVIKELARWSNLSADQEIMAQRQDKLKSMAAWLIASKAGSPELRQYLETIK
ncbi:MAG: O-antigen ligase family protein [Candidatus Buchananbacteria bacterium]